MSSLIRRLVLPPLAAASLILGVAGTALAGSPSATVTVFNGDGTEAGATVCDFYVQFNPLVGGESGAWELFGPGHVLITQGSYTVTDTDGDRVPDTGTWSLPNGTYEFRWDNETPVDSSHSEVDIVVSCAAETASPAPSATMTPSESPEQSVAAETSVPSPSFEESVAAETGLPTLPNTSADASAGSGGIPWAGLLMPMIAGLLAVLVMLAPRRGFRRR